MIRLARFALIFLLSSRFALAEWQVVHVTDEPSSLAALVRRHIDLEESDTGEHVALDLALFSTKACKLRVIDNSEGASLTALAPRSDALAAVNGGYFDPDFAPLGLRIIDGKITSRLIRGRLLSGVMASDKGTQILRVGEFSPRRKWDTAVECGPFLVDMSKAVRGLEGTRAARRTFAAVGSNERAAVGFCPEATLAGLGKILVTPLGDFEIQRALNLDGGSSSAFWFRRADHRVYYYPEQKTVRDFVAVVPR